MRYAQIREVDIANGQGIRVSLYTQGCSRHCPFCFNKETWDFKGGKAFTPELEEVLVELINKPHITGFTLLGGEPLEEENRDDVLKLLKHIKKECPNKSIWVYSSFLYEEIIEWKQPLLDYVDVLVDGEFINDLKDMRLKFRGSSNQRIIDINKTKEDKQITLIEID